MLARLAVEPENVLAAGKDGLDRLLQQHPSRGMTAHWLRQWRGVLDAGVDAVAEVFSSCEPRAIELRQNSPFAGALPPSERAQVLSAFQRHWRTDHTRGPGGVTPSETG